MDGRLSIMIASLVVCSAVGNTLPGTFLFNLGEATVTTLAERQQSLSKRRWSARPTICCGFTRRRRGPERDQRFLVKTGGKRVLVDTGLGLKLERKSEVGGCVPSRDRRSAHHAHAPRSHWRSVARRRTRFHECHAVYFP